MLKHLRDLGVKSKVMEKLLKSIKSLRSCILVLIFLTTIIIYTSGDIAEDEPVNRNVMDDFPTTNEFDLYFDALNKAVDFFVSYQHYVDINLQFGLFLVNMNLGQLLHQDRKKMSNETHSNLENLLEKLNVLAEYYRSMVEKRKFESILIHVVSKMSLLFYNKWPNPPKAFHTELLNQTRIMTLEQLETIYDTWEDYQYYVYNVEENRPTPAEIDECITLLVLNHPFHYNVRSMATCVLRSRCKKVMEAGAGNEKRYFGYGLTHRLLLLTIAHFADNCVVFSEKTDKEKSDMYCKLCFNEAEYIAYNNFQMPDLIFEQVALCSFYGHAQFMRNYWLKTVLQFQTSAGCFSEMLAYGNFEENELKEDEEVREWNFEGPDVIFGQCNAHFSGVAMASVSHALRYIIEKYY